MEFVSVNKIKIRLTGERLNHILTNHPEISEYVFDIGKTINSPDYLFERRFHYHELYHKKD